MNRLLATAAASSAVELGGVWLAEEGLGAVPAGRPSDDTRNSSAHWVSSCRRLSDVEVLEGVLRGAEPMVGLVGDVLASASVFRRELRRDVKDLSKGALCGGVGRGWGGAQDVLA